MNNLLIIGLLLFGLQTAADVSPIAILGPLAVVGVAVALAIGTVIVAAVFLIKAIRDIRRRRKMTDSALKGEQGDEKAE